MAGLRYWDGNQWQVLLGGPATYAVISSTAPVAPPNGMLWVQPVDPIVDLFSPVTLTEPDSWTWAGFGYGFPGLSFTPEAEGMRVRWNPTPAQNPQNGQLGCAPFTGKAFAGHQFLAQMTVNVPAGSPDVRLTHAFTSSTGWITEKDQDVTVSLPFIWADGMPAFVGVESGPAPVAGSALVKDIRLFDLTSSPPSPMRVWDESLGLWLPVNDGLVQRAGDRMVGSLRFDTIDAENNQPTVTGLPTPVDPTDAVPLGFLTDAIASIPIPEPTPGLIVSDVEPDHADLLVGNAWWDTSTPDVAPFMVVARFVTNAGTVLTPSATGWQDAGWPTFTIGIPCDGVLVIDHCALMASTVANGTAALRVMVRSSDGLTVAVAPDVEGNQGQARLAGATGTTQFKQWGKTVIVLSDVSPDGGSITLGFDVYASAGGAASFKTPEAWCKFEPYGGDSLVLLDLGSPS